MKLEVVYGWQCTRGFGEHIVAGQKGETYFVRISDDENTPHTCTCPYFTFRRLCMTFETCKHIDKVIKEEVCGWYGVTEPPELDGVKICPLCGSSVKAVGIAV